MKKVLEKIFQFIFSLLAFATTSLVDFSFLLLSPLGLIIWGCAIIGVFEEEE